MAHELRAFVDPGIPVKLTGRTLGIEEWVEPTILPERTTRPVVRETIDGNTQYLYGHYYLRDDADINRPLRKLGEGIGQYVSWGIIESRRSTVEYRDTVHARDPDYYRPSLTNGVRADTQLRQTEHLEARLSAPQYLVNGTEYRGESQTLSFQGHDTTQRVDRVIGTPSGVEIIVGTPSIDPSPPAEPSDSTTLALVTLYPSEIDAIDEQTQTEQYATTDWQTEYEFGSVPSNIPR